MFPSFVRIMAIGFIMYHILALKGYVESFSLYTDIGLIILWAIILGRSLEKRENKND